MAHFPVVGVCVQPPLPSQVSVVQAKLSSQLYVVPLHTPAAVHASLLVHALPSSHAVPVANEVQALVLVPGVHCWHGFAGFVAPLA
jgi:hypothetical protein